MYKSALMALICNGLNNLFFC